MQTWFSAGIDICIAILFGFYLVQDKLAAKLLIKKTTKLLSVLLLIFLCAFLIVATINISQAKLANLLPALSAVIRLTSLGNMIALAFAANIVIILINFSRPNYTSKPSKLINAIYLVGIFVFIYAKADIGHAADYGFIHLAVINHAIHLLAGSAWAGSVLACILLLTKWRKLQLENSLALAQHLSLIATIAVPITIICGIIDSFRILYEAHNIWHSAYIITLALKVILVAIAVVLGLINRWYWMPKMYQLNGKANYGFIQTIAIESMGLFLILIVAAKLGTTMIPS